MGQQLAPRKVADQRLESTSWCVRHSVWMLLPLLSAGLLTWAGLLLVSDRTGRADLRPRAGLFGAATGLVLVMIGAVSLRLSPLAPLAYISVIFLWAASAYQALRLNKEYLTAMAFRLPWHSEPVVESAPVPEINFDTSTPDATKIAELQQELAALVRQARTKADRLPVETMPTLRKLEKSLGDLLQHLGTTGALPEEMAAVSAPVKDYLPNSISAFLSLPEEISSGRRTLPGSTRTAGDELLNQLRLIADGVEETKDSVYAHDLQALATQGRFLDTKFRRSDLDL